jgi:membrane-bound lytic murein transglycosylase D
VLWLNGNKPKDNEALKVEEEVVVLAGEFVDWSAAAESGEHVVLQGETLYAISKLYNISVEELRQLNSLDGFELKPGQRLKVMQRATASVDQKPGIVHEVQRSETLYSVAKRYGVSVQDLMESNNKKDFSVALGEKLKIPAR